MRVNFTKTHAMNGKVVVVIFLIMSTVSQFLAAANSCQSVHLQSAVLGLQAEVAILTLDPIKLMKNPIILNRAVEIYLKLNQPMSALVLLARNGRKLDAKKLEEQINKELLESNPILTKLDRPEGPDAYSGNSIGRTKSGLKVVFRTSSGFQDWTREYVAYTLDRMLGLYIIPPLVLKKLNGHKGREYNNVKNAPNKT